MIPFTTSESILVVDECEPLCELIEVILCRVGYRVLTATNGADALALAGSSPKIDLLLSDVELPGMAGDELAVRFVTLHPLAQVILVSSLNYPNAITVPFEFLAKPFTVTELRNTVRRALRTRRRKPAAEVLHAV